ncbi:YusW family protein [Solibacillus cecembensis]|uniref:YusW family protein n=1 Tax=Solibacillus cecembensis TaxID=459347 RepID=UPI00071730EA
MKVNLLFALPLSLLLLVACNDDKVTEVTTTKQENTDMQTGANTNNTAKDGAFSFNSFSLDVDYGINDSFEVDYEVENNVVEASIEDRANTKFEGNDAYSQLAPIFKSFMFTSASTDQEIITEVLAAFKLDENYHEFEADIHFSDGSIKEFKVKK